MRKIWAKISKNGEYVFTGVFTFTLACMACIWQDASWIETLLASAVMAAMAVVLHRWLVKTILQK